MKKVSAPTLAAMKGIPNADAAYSVVDEYLHRIKHQYSVGYSSSCAEVFLINRFIGESFPYLKRLRKSVIDGVAQKKDSTSFISLIEEYCFRAELLTTLEESISGYVHSVPVPPFEEPWSDIETLRREKALLCEAMHFMNQWHSYK